MAFLARRVLIALLMFSALVLSAVAQEGVTVSGSGVAGQVFRAVVTDESFTYDLSGTQNGLNAFCGDATDIALANRALSVAEAAACSANGVEFSELLLGFDGYALIASPDVDFATCISTANLDTLIAPSLVGTETKWSAISSDYPELAFEFVYPGALSLPAALVDRVVRGEGFRSDATVVADNAAVIADVAAGSGKLGLVSLSDALSAEGVTLLELNNATLGNCIAPSAESALDRQYQGGDRLFVYVNAASLEKAGVAEALAALTAPEASEALIAAGITPLTESLREQVAAVVADATTGRVFSRDANIYQVTGDTTGTLRVGAASAGISYLKNALATISQRYSTITLEESYLGAPAAIREFCNGNREIIALTGEFTAEEQANCDANSITTYEIALGAHAAVLVANSSSDYLSCVSTATIKDVFAAGADLPATWNAYNSEFAEDPIYLFGASKSDSSIDLLLIDAAGLSVPVREDIQENADAAYRAAAVANTPGAVAVLTWADAQKVLAANEGIQLVSVQAEGGECTAPSAESIADGSYPLSQQVRLVVNARSLETPMVQAALYTLFADDNYIQIENAGFVGIAFSDLVNIRAELVDAFVAADTAEAQRFAEETAAQAEAEGEPTEEPTAEATTAP